jgi:hypothetical protein
MPEMLVPEAAPAAMQAAIIPNRENSIYSLPLEELLPMMAQEQIAALEVLPEVTRQPALAQEIALPDVSPALSDMIEPVLQEETLSGQPVMPAEILPEEPLLTPVLPEILPEAEPVNPVEALGPNLTAYMESSLRSPSLSAKSYASLPIAASNTMPEIAAVKSEVQITMLPSSITNPLMPMAGGMLSAGMLPTLAAINSPVMLNQVAVLGVASYGGLPLAV